MSNPGDENATPITEIGQLAEYLASGCKPKAEWRIGTEHEKFGFHLSDGAPVAYETEDGRGGGIRSILEGLASRTGWERIEDRGNLIGLKHGMASVSLEPGGQLELSGGPVETLDQTAAEMLAHFDDVRAVAAPMGIGFAPVGFHPTARLDQIGLMPKSRYGIMKRYMPQVGSMGLDMMFRTCTVQVNLDFSDEADMVRKLRVSTCLQPLATALFASSPFVEGRDSGFLSYRAQVWTDVDRARSGVPAVYFEEGFGFAAYVEWLLDVPMYFVMRDGRMLDVAGASFRRWLAGDEPRLAGHSPTVGDFADHSTTAFPDVRLKRFIEMRGADAGSPAMMVAQSALWVGLLYDSDALSAAERLVAATAPAGDWAALRGAVPRAGLAAEIGGRGLRAIASEVVAIAQAGLKARGFGETFHVDGLARIAAGGPTPAEAWRARFEGAWDGDAGRMLAEARV